MHSHAQEQGVFSFVPTRLLGFYLCLGLQAAAKMGAEAPCQSDTQVRQRERWGQVRGLSESGHFLPSLKALVQSLRATW